MQKIRKLKYNNTQDTRSKYILSCQWYRLHRIGEVLPSAPFQPSLFNPLSIFLFLFIAAQLVLSVTSSSLLETLLYQYGAQCEKSVWKCDAAETQKTSLNYDSVKGCEENVHF